MHYFTVVSDITFEGSPSNLSSLANVSPVVGHDAMGEARCACIQSEFWRLGV